MIELAACCLIAFVYFFSVIVIVPALGLFSMFSYGKKSKVEREFDPAPADDCEVRKVVCPTHHLDAQITVVGLKARANPETRYSPLRVASCTMPRNPAIKCDQRCRGQICAA